MRFILVLLLACSTMTGTAQGERLPLISGMMSIRHKWFAEDGEQLIAFSEMQEKWRELGMTDADFAVLFDRYWSYTYSFRTFQRKMTKRNSAVGAQVTEQDFVLFASSRYLIDLIEEEVIAPKWPYKLLNATGGIIEEMGYYGLRNGMRIAEIGAGGGLASMLVGSSYDSVHIYINDINDRTLEYLNGRFAQTAVFMPNSTFTIIEGTRKDCAIPAENLDLVFMREAYHHFKHKPEMLASIRRILAPDGRMLIKDQIKGRGEGYICSKANTREDIIATVTTNGFVLLEEIEIPTGHILFIFQKAGGE